MKKIAVLLLSVIMCFSLSFTANATSIDMSSPDLSIKDMFEEASSTPQVNSRGLSNAQCTTDLIGEDGSIYTVELFEYTPATLSNETSCTKTYVYSTQSEYVTPKAIGNTQTNTGWDDSISVYGYITVTYNSRKTSQDSDVTEYLLTNVSGGWEKNDSSVSMSNRFVAYTCQYIYSLSQVDWEYPTSNTFNYNTGYATYVPDDSTSAVLGAQCSVDLAHGTSSRWQLKTEANVLYNYIGNLL